MNWVPCVVDVRPTSLENASKLFQWEGGAGKKPGRKNRKTQISYCHRCMSVIRRGKTEKGGKGWLLIEKNENG